MPSIVFGCAFFDKCCCGDKELEPFFTQRLVDKVVEEISSLDAVEAPASVAVKSTGFPNAAGVLPSSTCVPSSASTTVLVFVDDDGIPLGERTSMIAGVDLPDRLLQLCL